MVLRPLVRLASINGLHFFSLLAYWGNVAMPATEHPSGGADTFLGGGSNPLEKEGVG